MSRRVPLQVLHLTGQSDPRSCALSPVQHAFLDDLDLPADAVVRLNWPYDVALAPRPHRPVPLWLASLRHAVLFLAMRTRGWRARHRAPVLAQLARAEHTLVLAGSIGLDLLGRLDLPPTVLDRVTVLAYGAVATRPPACRTVRVGSRGDHVARWSPGPPPDLVVDVGHLDYLASPEVLALAQTLVAELRRPGVAG